ncbi:MAG TPA: ribonuclease III, partial [Lysobacter sp.]
MSERGARRGLDAHRFADESLLMQALTHRSAGAPHNERL